MLENNFYNFFEEISSKLGVREQSFRKIFNYLDKMPDPIIIVETVILIICIIIFLLNLK